MIAKRGWPRPWGSRFCDEHQFVVGACAGDRKANYINGALNLADFLALFTQLGTIEQKQKAAASR